MAFVGISKQLVADTCSRISQMEDAERKTISVDEAEVQSVAAYLAQESVLDRIIWKEHLPIKNLLPEEWVVLNREVDVHLVVVAPDAARVSNMVNVKLGFNYACPPKTSSYRPDIKYELPPTIEETPVKLQKMYKVMLDEHELSSRWKKTKAKVKEFLENCKSLNEALKLWPELATYIPESYTTKLQRSVERAQKVSRAMEVLKTIDTQEIQAQAVIARLSGAKL